MIFIKNIAIIQPWIGDDVIFTSPFGERIHPVTKKRKFHNGIDVVIQNDVVTACYSGVVEFCGQWQDEYSKTAGKVVVLKHYDHVGNYQGKSRYYHLNDVLVSIGDNVKVGQQIGVQGWSGSVDPPDVNGKHLHFEIEDRNGKKLDPCELINIIGVPQQKIKYKTWSEPIFVELNQAGYEWYERRFSEPITRAETMAVQHKQLKKEGKL